MALLSSYGYVALGSATGDLFALVVMQPFGHDQEDEKGYYHQTYVPEIRCCCRGSGCKILGSSLFS